MTAAVTVLVLVDDTGRYYDDSRPDGVVWVLLVWDVALMEQLRLGPTCCCRLNHAGINSDQRQNRVVTSNQRG